MGVGAVQQNSETITMAIEPETEFGQMSSARDTNSFT